MPKRFVLVPAVPFVPVVSGIVTFHETDSGNTGYCHEHGDVVVSLVEYPKEGLKWVIKSKDPIFFQTDESKKTLTADTQERVFRFDPSKGTGVLTFAYRNPWSANAQDIKTVNFTVTVS